MKPVLIVLLLVALGAIIYPLVVGSNPTASKVPTGKAQPLKQAFTSLLKGQSQSQVIQLLGKPKTRTIAQYPMDSFWGPQEGLGKFLPKHQKYLEFTYSDGTDDFYIWFSGEDPESQTAWTLVSKATYPVNVDF